MRRQHTDLGGVKLPGDAKPPGSLRITTPYHFYREDLAPLTFIPEVDSPSRAGAPRSHFEAPVHASEGHQSHDLGPVPGAQDFTGVSPGRIQGATPESPSSPCASAKRTFFLTHTLAAVAAAGEAGAAAPAFLPSPPCPATPVGGARGGAGSTLRAVGEAAGGRRSSLLEAGSWLRGGRRDSGGAPGERASAQEVLGGEESAASGAVEKVDSGNVPDSGKIGGIGEGVEEDAREGEGGNGGQLGVCSFLEMFGSGSPDLGEALG